MKLYYTATCWKYFVIGSAAKIATSWHLFLKRKLVISTKGGGKYAFVRWALNLVKFNQNILRQPALQLLCDVISKGRQLRMCLEIVVSRDFVDKIVFVPLGFFFAFHHPFLLMLFSAANLTRDNKTKSFDWKWKKANEVVALFLWYVFCLQLASFASCEENKFLKTSWNVVFK